MRIALLALRAGLDRVVRRDEPLEFVERHGAREMEALHEVASHVLEHFSLLERLDALGDDWRIETLQHSDDRAEHNAAAIFVHGGAHEAHVELHDVDGDVLQHVQRRQATAEVVHLDHHVVFAHLFDDAVQAVGFLYESAFGDFEMKAAIGKLVFTLQFEEMLHQPFLEHLGARHVHRDGNRLAIRDVAPTPGVTAGFFPYEQIEIVNLAAILENGDELGWAYPSHIGMVPTRQRFSADDLAVRVVDLGLIPYFDLPVHESVVYRLLDSNAAHVALKILLREHEQNRMALAMSIAMRNRRVIHRAIMVAGFEIDIAQVIHASCQRQMRLHAIAVSEFVDSLDELPELGLRFIKADTVGHEDETVGAKARNGMIVSQQRPYAIDQALEDKVAPEETEFRVDRAEIADVDIPQGGLVKTLRQHLGCERAREHGHVHGACRGIEPRWRSLVSFRRAARSYGRTSLRSTHTSRRASLRSAESFGRATLRYASAFWSPAKTSRRTTLAQ